MKKLFSFTFLPAFALIILLIALPTSTVFAAYADGSYDVPVEIKEDGTNNTSIADGYFNDTAKLIVENGVNYVHLTVSSADYVKSVSGPNGEAQVISESGDTKTLKLQVGDMSAPIHLDMHIVVPEEVAGMEYDNNHSTQAVFDVSGVPTASTDGGETTEESSTESGTTTEDGTNESVENPPTGDSTPIAMYIALLVGSIALFAVYKFRFARN